MSHGLQKQNTVRNQVFIGCPYHTVRPKYERIVKELKKKYPICFEIIGRTTKSEAMELLDLIKIKLGSSSAAIFDATGGNANVSLEFGFAEAKNIPRHIFISEHGAIKRSSRGGSIIADLQGKVRNIYKQESILRILLDGFCRIHPYQIKFDKVMKRELRRQGQGNKIKYRKLAIKIIHRLDHQEGGVRRSDLLQDVLVPH
ncbi:MAG: hypothetical protein G01um101466_486 [Parcubacteria group bacterium Gr01-1014_66]|nr:MAG: hypothetical protein G01um101466_486 [Parcubacteria group bacterium Gr01-1014_66]